MLGIISLIILILLIILIGWFVLTYNGFIRLRNLKDESWSGIDVQLRRRYNLIPNLVETVKGYMQHERGLFADIARLRTKCLETANVREKGEADHSLTQALKTLFAVSENYPALKANENFMNLQETLSSIEEEIQMARRYYNGTIRNYNIKVQTFPSMLIARIFGFRKEEFFQVEGEIERQVPSVKFEKEKSEETKESK